jgi:hypothetical protein
MNKMIPTYAFIEYGSLTSATSTSQIKIGVETDNDSNIMLSTPITALSNTFQEYSPILVKPTTTRKIILTPTIEGLTGGQVKIIVKCKLGL